MRKSIPTKQRVALTLWYVATDADYRTIVWRIYCLYCYQGSVIVYPNNILVMNKKTLWRGLAMGWASHNVQEWLMEPIVSPEKCFADYYNRKGWHHAGNGKQRRSFYRGLH